MGCNTLGTASLEEGSNGKQIKSQMISISLAIKSEIVTIQRITRKYTSSTPTVLKWH